MASPSTAAQASTPRPGPLLIRADATASMGVGHAMRCLALAQEVLGTGRPVVLAGELSVPWVAQAYEHAGVELVTAPASPQALAALARRLDAAAVLLDGYLIEAATGEALRAAGVRVGAMVDAEFGAHQVADLYVDQNPGATARETGAGQRALAGARYTLFRDDVLRARAERTGHDDGATAGPPASRRLLAVFGGTDPFGAARTLTPLIVEAAARIGCPIHLDVVTPEAASVTAHQGDLPPGSTITALPALPDLAARAASADLVVTASGSTVWELLCIGVPTALVCVVDNQTPGYEMATEGGYVAALGHLDALRTSAAAREAAINALVQALTDDVVRRKRSEAGRRLLDGLGRRRVAESLLG